MNRTDQDEVVTFNPFPDNRKRLEWAVRKLGLPKNQVVNEVLLKHLRNYLMEKAIEKARDKNLTLTDLLNSPDPIP
ncbi:MAG: hypothetical protein KGJ60_09505 [Verrucomicrobiota bacterium]|nr:hypothetical protein [Verrucomicrobiota bacterium]